MLPKIIDKKLEKGIFYILTENRTITAIVKTEHLDAEHKEDLSYLENLESFFKEKKGFSFRVISCSKKVQEEDKKDIRSQAFKEIGFVEHNLFIALETKDKLPFSNFLKSTSKNYFEKRIKDLKNSLSFNFLESMGVKISPISDFSEIENLFLNEKETFKNDGFFLYDGNKYISILKLKSFNPYLLDYLSFARVKRCLPYYHKIVGKYQLIDPTKAELHVSKISKNEEFGRSLISEKKYENSEKTLGALKLEGESLVKLELHIILENKDKEELKIDRDKTLKALSPLGEFIQESVGLWSAFISTFIGSDFHIKGDFSHLLDKSKVIPCFMPLFIFGNDKKKEEAKALSYHRLDFSKDYFDPFCKENDNYNSLVLAKSGKGKSVFANLLIRSLYQNPNLHLIITDVKGSHSKTVSELKGEEIPISLDKACGINPLKLIKEKNSLEVLELIVSFLEQLLLEREEKFLPEKEKAILEKKLLSYIKNKPKNPSIDDFLKFNSSSSFSRLELLKRWSSSGMYHQVFSSITNKKENKRLKYYNFKHLSSANNPVLIRGIVSSIMADFLNFVLTSNSDRRFLFIADEVPFFLKHSFDVYSLMAKNLRKLGGGLFLIAQTLDDLSLGGKDYSLIDQASNKILFSLEGQKDHFKKILDLSTNDIEKLKELKTIKGEFSQALIKTDNYNKIANLILSKKEYFQATTFDEDLKKIDEIKKLISWLPDHLITDLVPYYK